MMKNATKHCPHTLFRKKILCGVAKNVAGNFEIWLKAEITAAGQHVRTTCII